MQVIHTWILLTWTMLHHLTGCIVNFWVFGVFLQYTETLIKNEITDLRLQAVNIFSKNGCKYKGWCKDKRRRPVKGDESENQTNVFSLLILPKRKSVITARVTLTQGNRNISSEHKAKTWPFHGIMKRQIYIFLHILFWSGDLSFFSGGLNVYF